MDSNHRPPAYQADALTCWAISPFLLPTKTLQILWLLPRSRQPLLSFGFLVCSNHRSRLPLLNFGFLVSSRHLIFCLLGMVQVRQPWLFESLLSLLQLAPLFPVGNFLFAQILSSFRVRRLAAGGDNRDRTDDPLLAKQVLSQLSYTPIASFPFFQGSFTLRNALLFTKKVSSLRKHHNLLAS